jgi:hypothetical protein
MGMRSGLTGPFVSATIIDKSKRLVIRCRG